MMRAVITLHTMEKADRQQRRHQGVQWLYEAVAAYGYRDVTPENCPLERTEKGKPYFPVRSDIHFSISHSQDQWACVIADQPVGLDIQYHKKGRLDHIPSRFFHPQEATWLENLTETPALWRRAFFDIWAAKESYVKWTGQGIDREFSHFSVVDEKGILREIFGKEQKAFFYPVVIAEDYSLFLCAGEPWDQVQIVIAE